MIKYELKRSKRKTIAIYITADGDVEVRSPLKASKSVIDEFVTSKEKWIEKHLKAVRNRVKTPLVIGGTMLFLGREFPILKNEGPSYFDGEAMYIQKETDIYNALSEFYRCKAKEIIPDMVYDAEAEMGLRSNKISITSAKTRWGSCSGKNNLNFSWRLMMAELNAVKYVVIHELAHIKEKNHGTRFWELVAKYEPDYKIKREKLRQLAIRLDNDGWK